MSEADQYRQATRRGLRPSKAKPCPLTVIGKRCQAFRKTRPCICEPHIHLLRHARIWRDPPFGPVLTFEPVTITAVELSRMWETLDRLGIKLIELSEPGWFDGKSLMFAAYRIADPRKPIEGDITMTDNDDPLAAAILQAVSNLAADPRPRAGLTAETLIALDSAKGESVRERIPGAPIFGSDGDWIGVEENRTVSATMAKVRVHADERARIGVPEPGDNPSPENPGESRP